MKLTKDIVPAGKFRATDPISGKRKDEVISPERLNNWVATFQKMKANGIRVPAPFRHDLKIAGLTQAQVEALAQEEKDKGSLLNGGYWEDLFINKDTGKLTGIIDVPDSLSDKVGNTVKECSLYALPEWEDGSGNKYTDPILHIALVTHPVVTGQDNFKPYVDENATAVAMSQLIEPVALSLEPVPNAYYAKTKDILAQLGLTLPENVNAENILEYVCVAGTALLAERSKNASNPGATDPATGLTLVPSPGGSLMSVKIEADSPAGRMIAKQQTQRLKDRITALITDGRISVETANDILMPKLTGCVMSLDVSEDGTLGPTSLDDTLEVLERFPRHAALTGTVLKDGDKRSVKVNGSAFSIEGDAPDAENVIDENKAQSIIDEINKNIGKK